MPMTMNHLSLELLSNLEGLVPLYGMHHGILSLVISHRCVWGGGGGSLILLGPQALLMWINLYNYMPYLGRVTPSMEIS